MICKRKYCYLRAACFGCCWCSYLVLKLWKPVLNWASYWFCCLFVYFGCAVCTRRVCVVSGEFWFAIELHSQLLFQQSFQTDARTFVAIPLRIQHLHSSTLLPSNGFICDLTTCSFVYLRGVHMHHVSIGRRYFYRCMYYT